MTGHAHAEHGGDKRVALLIAILALFLAIAETGAKSAQTEAISRNVEAANLWAFFQARTIRQTTVRTAADQAGLALPTADAAQRALIERQQAAWRAQADRWESEPANGEGRRELAERARAAEAKRDRAGDAGVAVDRHIHLVDTAHHRDAADDAFLLVERGAIVGGLF